MNADCHSFHAGAARGIDIKHDRQTIPSIARLSLERWRKDDGLRDQGRQLQAVLGRDGAVRSAITHRQRKPELGRQVVEWHEDSTIPTIRHAGGLSAMASGLLVAIAVWKPSLARTRNRPAPPPGRRSASTTADVLPPLAEAPYPLPPTGSDLELRRARLGDSHTHKLYIATRYLIRSVLVVRQNRGLREHLSRGIELPQAQRGI